MSMIYRYFTPAVLGGGLPTITDRPLASGSSFDADTFLRILSDPSLSSGSSFSADTFLRILSDPALVNLSSLEIDTFRYITHLTDEHLDSISSLEIDAFLHILHDSELENVSTLQLDVFAYEEVEVSPYWLWHFVRSGDNLFIIPALSRKGWTNVDTVSDDYKYTTAHAARAARAVQAVWAAHKDDDTATLKAAIDAALLTYGFRTES